MHIAPDIILAETKKTDRKFNRRLIMAKTVTIVISDGKMNHEFYDVPVKVGNAVRTILEECANDETGICFASRYVDPDGN